MLVDIHFFFRFRVTCSTIPNPFDSYVIFYRRYDFNHIICIMTSESTSQRFTFSTTYLHQEEE
jgi:hypothetical protein